MTTDLELNKTRARAFLEAIGAKDAEAIFQMYAPDAIFWQNGRTLPTAGAHTIAETAAMTPKIYARLATALRFRIISVTAEENRVAIEAESYATLTDGRPYTNQYHFLIRLNEAGKIAELREYWDPLYALETLFDGKPAR